MKSALKHSFLVALLFIAGFAVQAQTYDTDLRGFRLKQTRKVAQNELGRPAKSGKFDDGFEYEQYLLKPDASLYMVFEYSAEHTDLIWSIQISGTDPTADLGFHELRFGMDQAQVEKQFGKPQEKTNVGEFGNRWDYENSNVSFEISPQGKLSSIKIKYISDVVYPRMDAKKLPVFGQVIKVLQSSNRTEIAKLLAPDMWLYRGKATLFFAKSLKTEIATDDSKIFATVSELAAGLEKVNPKAPDEYEENLRVSQKLPLMYVIKLKKHRIKELVFSYEWGEFVIWELKADEK
ncbi:MAG TPA: hypothetical protein VLL54_02995 [Pyrinomonadaceae bacterium]|nr:hypothetical protein [Pyrinomonadaceae bacterium]